MIRDRIWTNLVNSKFKCIYIGYLLNDFQKTSFAINIFLTILSLTSVSAWVIWNIVPWLWSILIATSNILLAIKPLLAYDKRIKELAERLTVLEEVQFEYEKLWYQYETNTVDEKVAFNKFFELYDRQIKSLRTSGEIMLNESKKLKLKSDRDTDIYIRNNYNVIIA